MHGEGHNRSQLPWYIYRDTRLSKLQHGTHAPGLQRKPYEELCYIRTRVYSYYDTAVSIPLDKLFSENIWGKK